jgi:hypothetical protein
LLGFCQISGPRGEIIAGAAASARKICHLPKAVQLICSNQRSYPEQIPSKPLEHYCFLEKMAGSGAFKHKLRMQKLRLGVPNLKSRRQKLKL